MTGPFYCPKTEVFRIPLLKVNPFPGGGQAGYWNTCKTSYNPALQFPRKQPALDCWNDQDGGGTGDEESKNAFAVDGNKQRQNADNDNDHGPKDHPLRAVPVDLVPILRGCK